MKCNLHAPTGSGSPESRRPVPAGESAASPRHTFRRALSLAPAALIVIVFCAPALLAPYPDAYEDDILLSAGRSLKGDLHLLGTDRTGRDFLSVLIRATAASFSYALLGTVLLVGGALILGFIQGATRRRLLASFLGALTLGCMALPDLAIVAMLRSGWPRNIEPLTAGQLQHLVNVCLILSLALLAIPIESRLFADRISDIVSKPFYGATKMLGTSSLYLFLFEILPLLAEDLAWIFALAFPRFIHAEIGLTYLGLGYRGGIGLGAILSSSFEEFQNSTAMLQLLVCTLALVCLALLPQLILRAAGLTFNPKKGPI